MITEKEIIEAGKFLKPHALKGEMNAFCEYDNDILEQGFPLIVDMDGIYVPFYVKSVRPKGLHGSLILIDGVESVDDTSRFINKPFYLMRSDVAEYMEVEEDELDQADDFIGYLVEDPEAGVVGKVVDVDDSTANILLVVQPDEEDGEDVIYIPFAEDLIEDVEDYDDDSEIPGKIIMKIPEGLLDINDKDSDMEILD